MEWRSQNGRWGLSVATPDDVDLRTPQPGRVVSLGTLAGVAAYRFDPDPQAQTWVTVMSGSHESVTAIGGATVVEDIGLQGGRSVSLLVLGPVAVIRTRHYRGRGASVDLFRDGRPDYNADTATLIGLGVEPDTKPQPVADPPGLTGALAVALRSAGVDVGSDR